MKKILLAAVALVACDRGTSDEAPIIVTTPTPSEYAAGDRLYTANCSQCHGIAGSGTTSGPPLVHRIYEPAHHADASFYRAVELGVAAHHWRFGNMEAVPGLERQEIAEIIGYVRWLQREAGIF